MSRIFVAHSMTLKTEAEEEFLKVEAAGHYPLMPVWPNGKTECRIHELNALTMRAGDVVFAIWDGVSDGCYGDVCMAIALGKPVYVRVLASPGLLSHRKQYPNDALMKRAWALFSELPKIEEWWAS